MSAEEDKKKQEDADIEKLRQAADADNTKAMKTESDASSTVTFIKQKPKPGLLRAKIYTPFKTFFEGDAKTISALNESGRFDVLPGHHNFITMLLPCDVKVLPPEGKEKVIPIARGLMHVRDDRLIIFLDV